MTVSELIQILEKLPPSAKVTYIDHYNADSSPVNGAEYDAQDDEVMIA